MTTGKIASALAALALLSACGGDDTGTPTPPPNQAPTITNATLDVNYPENDTAAVLTLAINDEAVASVVITLGGADAGLFAIANGRDLVFNNPPDFENPQDADGNNVYELSATATDSLGRSSTVDITVTVTDDATAMRFVDPVFAGTDNLGTVAMVTPSGNSAISFTGPAGDTLMARPLVVLGGAQMPGAQAVAVDLAMRGYLVGAVDSTAPADLAAIATGFGNGAFGSLGIDAGAIAVAAPGDARFGSMLQSTFADSGIPVHAFAPGSTSAFGAAVQFHEALIAGRE